MGEFFRLRLPFLQESISSTASSSSNGSGEVRYRIVDVVMKGEDQDILVDAVDLDKVFREEEDKFNRAQQQKQKQKQDGQRKEKRKKKRTGPPQGPISIKQEVVRTLLQDKGGPSRSPPSPLLAPAPLLVKKKNENRFSPVSPFFR